MNGINTHKPSWDIKIWLPLLLAVAYGIFARLYNLGHWELTIDEYYIVKSIESILDNGLPSFGCGGYYERGLLQQYLTAPLIAYCDNTAFAARILPALANILAFPVMFKLAEKVSQSRLIASIVTGLFALSLWEIEFARFARMYSFFQLVFILQLYWLLEILVDGRIDRYKYLLLTTALGIFIYQGVIFSLILCVLPIALCHRKIKPPHILGLIATTLLVAVRTKINFRSFLAEARFPAEYLPPINKISLPVYIPEVMLGDLSIPWLVGGLVIMVILLFLLVKHLRKQASDPLLIIVFLSALTSAAAHQFSLALALILTGICFGIFKDEFKQHFRLCVLILIIPAVYWLLFGIVGLNLGLPQVVKLMGKYPSIYWNVLSPFFQSTPRESLILFPVLLLGGSWQIAAVIRNGKTNAPAILLGLCILLSLAQSALVTPEKVTRYSFFLYPAVLVLFCYYCVKLPQALNLSSSLKHAASAGLLIIFISMSENYYAPHLLRLSSAEFNFRIPYHRFLQFHFYQRYSFVDAAEFVNQRLSEGDQVITTTPGIDYYLDQLDYTYSKMGSQRFRNTSACSGTRYIWNDSPLIYTEQALLERVAIGEKSTWIITGENGKGQSIEDAFIKKHYGDYLSFIGRDKQVKVYKIMPGTSQAAHPQRPDPSP